MSWEQLLGIYQANDELEAYYLDSPPRSCPNDGHPLQIDQRGCYFCPFDGWIWDGSPYTKAD